MCEIYSIKNNINNKLYIGQTLLSRGTNKRFNEHINEAINNIKGCTALNNAILKYGKDNFTVNVLLICSVTLSDHYESKFIEMYNTISPNGYNIKTGGKKGKHCEESKERMRNAKLGEKNPNYGKPRSEEFKQKLRDKKSGENHHFYNKKLTLDHKLKLSKAHRKNGNDLPMYMIKIEERPQYYQGAGYAILSHPNGKNKYFTSKKFKMEEKKDMALAYLNNLNKNNN